MTGFKSYFSAHIRSNLRTYIYILTITATLGLILGLSAQPQKIYQHTGYVLVYSSTLIIPVCFMCVLAYVLPIIEFSFFKKRRNLDCAYALPISRRCMGIVHFLSGSITLVGTFTFSYILNFVLLLTHGIDYFDFSPLIVHYLLCIVLGLALYSIMIFVYNEANTNSDGIWFMILWTFVVALVLSGVEAVFSKYIDLNYNGCVIPWGVIDSLTRNYQYIVEMRSISLANFWQKPEQFSWVFIWIAVGIAAAFGFILSFGKRRMELTEEISDSFFGYRVMIPIYTIFGMLWLGCYSAVFWVITEALALLGYTIYRRGFHYKKADIIFLISMILFLFVGAYMNKA